MKDQESRVDNKYEKFTWKVENFSRILNVEKLYSEPFVLGGYPWRILLYPQGCDDEDFLWVYLDAVHSANMSKGWSRHVKFRLAVFNQVDSNNSITEEVFVYEIRHEKQVNQAAGLTASLTSGGQTGYTDVEIPRPVPEGQGSNLETLPRPVLTPVCIEPTKHTNVDLFSASIGEIMDFRGLGQVEKAFVPLLEEVCSQHSSLIEGQQKRSRKFTARAFNALGRVLYFLKTKKAKHINEQAWKDLQALWEELGIFRFDLTWLEPHVQSIFGMKCCVEKVLQVEKLKDNVVALDLEIERLKAKLVTAKVDLEVNLDAEKDLLKAKGFDKIDLDAELGYGRLETVPTSSSQHRFPRYCPLWATCDMSPHGFVLKRRLGGLRQVGVYKLPLALISKQCGTFWCIRNSSPPVKAKGLRAVGPLPGAPMFRPQVRSIVFRGIVHFGPHVM